MIDEPQNDIPNENEEQKPDEVRFDYDMIQYRLKTGQEVARFRTDYAERYGDEDLPPEYVDPTSKPVEDDWTATNALAESTRDADKIPASEP